MIVVVMLVVSLLVIILHGPFQELASTITSPDHPFTSGAMGREVTCIDWSDLRVSVGEVTCICRKIYV